MNPEVYNITYYEGDTFTITVFPKDSANGYIDLTGATPYFRLAAKRDNTTDWNTNGYAVITALVPGGPACIKCDLSTEIGRNIKNNYVYDIGFIKANTRTTVLTGAFQVMSEVKTSGSA